MSCVAGRRRRTSRETPSRPDTKRLSSQRLRKPIVSATFRTLDSHDARCMIHNIETADNRSPQLDELATCLWAEARASGARPPRLWRWSGHSRRENTRGEVSGGGTIEPEGGSPVNPGVLLDGATPLAGALGQSRGSFTEGQLQRTFCTAARCSCRSHKTKTGRHVEAFCDEWRPVAPESVFA